MTANYWQPSQPYNRLPALPPEGVELESKAVLKRCIQARAALAELKQAAELIPNQGMLIGTLPLLEAQASSEIENIVTTNDRLFELQNRQEDADPATREALRYRWALLEGFGSLGDRPLTTSTAEVICSRIKDATMRVRNVPGTKLANPRTGEVVYTPPEGQQVLNEMLANWERFLNEPSDLDPLVRMAAGHYQFEAIHPFTDGNGRTGRIINSLYLIQQGLLTLPVLYLSRYIITRKTEYYDRLLGVTAQNEWEPWLLYMLEGVAQTSTWTTAKITAIRRLFDATADYVRAAQPKIYSYELINLIFEQPYCRIQTVVDARIVERQTASRYLKELVRAGVLQQRKVGREVLFVHPRLMRLLTSDDNEYEPLK